MQNNKTARMLVKINQSWTALHSRSNFHQELWHTLAFFDLCFKMLFQKLFSVESLETLKICLVVFFENSFCGWDVLIFFFCSWIDGCEREKTIGKERGDRKSDDWCVIERKVLEFFFKKKFNQICFWNFFSKSMFWDSNQNMPIQFKFILSIL